MRRARDGPDDPAATSLSSGWSTMSRSSVSGGRSTVAPPEGGRARRWAAAAARTASGVAEPPRRGTACGTAAALATGVEERVP
jgi:hypothetical protein